MDSPAAFRPGDRVTWMYQTRGNYGLTVPVAGVVMKVGAKLVQIRIAFRTYISREWRVTERWVSPDRLQRRSDHVPQLDDVSSGEEVEGVVGRGNSSRTVEPISRN